MRAIRTIVIIFLGICVIGGCHSSQVQTLAARTTAASDTQEHRKEQPIKFSFQLKTLLSLTHPDDEINIDTTGQMVFEVHQQMKTGKWRTPTGFSYLNIEDDDTLWSFIKRASLFDIQTEDVKPECPSGDVLLLSFYRSDLNKKISFQTNVCAKDYNLLTGEQRKYFPEFLAFIGRMRDKYRPHLKE